MAPPLTRTATRDWGILLPVALICAIYSLHHTSISQLLSRHQVWFTFVLFSGAIMRGAPLWFYQKMQSGNYAEHRIFSYFAIIIAIIALIYSQLIEVQKYGLCS
jgi:type VI protein secretion system component VasK